MKNASKSNILSGLFRTEVFAVNEAKAAIDDQLVNQGRNTGNFTLQLR